MYDKIILTEDPTMLIEFTVKNFASFKDETTLSAETGNRLRKLKDTNTFYNKKPALLKSLLLFGPNGSGKSQLVRAIQTMKRLLIYPAPSEDWELIYKPFIFSNDPKTKDTSFEIKLELSNKIYNYSFSYNKRKIISEELCSFEKGRKNIIFSRKGNKIVSGNQQLNQLNSKLLDNSFVLYLAQSIGEKNSKTVYNWFLNDLEIMNNFGEFVIPSQLVEVVEKRKLKHRLLSFLHAVDVDIEDFNIRDVSSTSIVIKNSKLTGDKNRNEKELFPVHKIYVNNKKISFKERIIDSESKGVQWLIYFGLLLLFAQQHENGKTILIDDFDANLHLKLTKSLINFINSKENQNQFIITTQTPQLMDCRLRIDQIYLMDKNFQGVSSLRSIFDFEDARNKGRHDISFAKRYLEGRYGAVPIINNDQLVAALSKNE